MLRLPSKIKRLICDENAATAVEYALLLALIIIAGLAAVLSTGDVQKAFWFDTADKIQVIVP